MATPDREPGQSAAPRDPDGAEAPQQPWWEQGEEPDYRATLANERTFLAWTRTSLALLAGSLAILPLRQAGPGPLRLTLSAYLIALALGTTVTGYVQWKRRQQRMRQQRPLGHSGFQAVIMLGLLLLAGLICAVVAAGSAP